MIGRAVVASFVELGIDAKEVTVFTSRLAQLNTPLESHDACVQCSQKLVDGSIASSELGQPRNDPGLDVRHAPISKSLQMQR